MGLKRTGSGKASFVQGTHDNYKRILLYNFDIDGHDIKREHREFLDKHVVPMMDRDGTVAISGRASRTGSDQHNGTLSEKRAKEVFKYLLRTRRSSRIFSYNGTGEKVASDNGLKNGTEDELYRAVLVTLSKNGPPPKKPDAEIKPAPPRKNWSVDMRASVDIRAYDLFVFKKMLGSFKIGAGFCMPYVSWDLSASKFKLTVPFKGRPPLFPSGFKARGKFFAYDKDLIDFKAMWKDKTIHCLTAGPELIIEVRNALPRICSASYQPFKGSGIKCIGRHVQFQLRGTRLELGGAVGVGSIQDPKPGFPTNCA